MLFPDFYYTFKTFRLICPCRKIGNSVQATSVGAPVEPTICPWPIGPTTSLEIKQLPLHPLPRTSLRVVQEHTPYQLDQGHLLG